MLKNCKWLVFTLMTLIIFSVGALSSSAIEVKADSVDTISVAMANAKKAKNELIVTGDSLNVRKKKTMLLSAEVTGVDEQPAITWSSSDTDVATVNEIGLVKGISVGRTLIKATAVVNGKTLEGYYNINVITGKGPLKELFAQRNVFSYRYDYVDDVFYTNDKECWQKPFGFARIYDILAPYAAMEYDYTRVFFNYNDKDYMVQMWKGQYGLTFYGGEIGVYSKPESDKKVNMFTFFKVAEPEDWPMMELTIYHQKLNGKWKREFTRDYDRYWWCTGFKAGHLRISEPADELRMVSRITFTNEEMAELFANGLNDCGFAPAKNKDKMGLDTYHLDGADVYVKWQNISEAENTVAFKVGAVSLLFFNVFAIIIMALLMMGFGGVLALFLFI